METQFGDSFTCYILPMVSIECSFMHTKHPSSEQSKTKQQKVAEFSSLLRIRLIAAPPNAACHSQGVCLFAKAVCVCVCVYAIGFRQVLEHKKCAKQIKEYAVDCFWWKIDLNCVSIVHLIFCKNFSEGHLFK